MIPINYLAVVVAAVAAYVLGALWHGPLFGKQYIKLAGWPPEKVAAMKTQNMAQSYGLMLVTQLIMAYVLAHMIVFASDYTGTFGYQAGLMAGFWSWLGFIATTMLGGVLWENKSWGMYCFNITYQLAAILLMGVILAVWA
jgi:hypothetical protein